MRILTKRTSSYRIVTSPLPTPEPFPNAHSFFSSLPSYCHLHPLKRKIGRKKEDTRQNCNFGIRDKKRYSLLTCFVLLYFAKKTISLSAKAERGEEGTGKGGEGGGGRGGEMVEQAAARTPNCFISFASLTLLHRFVQILSKSPSPSHISPKRGDELPDKSGNTLQLG